MVNNRDVLFKIVRSAMYGETKVENLPEDVDWLEIYQMAGNNKLIPLLSNLITNPDSGCNPPENITRAWKSAALRFMVNELEKYKRLKSLLQEAERKNLKFIVFKGCVLADLYPQYVNRTMCDADIFVYERDKAEAVQLFEKLGYKKDEESSKEQVYVYWLDGIFEVELHFRLWEDHKGAKVDLIAAMNLTDESKLLNMEACHLQITTLGYEEHLIYQIFHIVKHFSLQGIGIRYLVDIVYYVNRYYEKIDFKDFWRKIEILGYTKFCEYFFTIGIDKFGMRKDVFQDRKVEVAPNMQGFVTDLLNVGVMYENKDAAWQILGIMTPYFTGQKEVPKTRLERNMKVIFPASSALPDKYAYAKKVKILLPVAWVHKWVCYLIKWYKNRDNWYDAKEKLDVAEHRLYMMKSLGLIDENK